MNTITNIENIITNMNNTYAVATTIAYDNANPQAEINEQYNPAQDYTII